MKIPPLFIPPAEATRDDGARPTGHETPGAADDTGSGPTTPGASQSAPRKAPPKKVDAPPDEPSEADPAKLRVLVLTGGQGNTHRIHMADVLKTFEKKHPELDVTARDVEITGIVRDDDLQKTYDETSKDPGLNEEAWKKKQASPEMQARGQALRKLLDETKPDVVLGNYDTIVRQLMDVMSEPGARRPPTVQHLSDLGRMHPNWIPPQFLEQDSKDVVLMMGKAIRPGKSDQKQFALDRGMPKERIRHVGAPVRQAFNEVGLKSPKECRKILKEKYGVDVPDDKPSVLLMCGSGFWPEKMIATAKALADSELGKGLHIKVIAGKSEAARKVLKDRVDEVFGYIDDDEKLALLSKAVTVPCIKAGGGAIPDMVNLHKGFVVFEALPGPEPENALWVEEQGVGRVALTMPDLIDTLTDLIKNPHKMEDMERAQTPHIVRDGAERITSIVSDIAKEGFNRRTQASNPAQGPEGQAPKDEKAP